MNTQLKNYLDLQEKMLRIEQLTNADWDTKYMLKSLYQQYGPMALT